MISTGLGDAQEGTGGAYDVFRGENTELDLFYCSDGRVRVGERGRHDEGLRVRY